MLKAFKVLKLAITTFLLSLTFLSADNLESASIATLDQDRLYRSSLFGQRVLQEINDKSDKLLANELLLQSELESEEQALTEKRKKIDIEEFKVLAANFDEKVQKFRAETTEARIKLNEYSEAERNRFFKLITPILVELSKEFGVSTLLDHRMVIISLNDITDHSVNRVNKTIGTGKDVNND